MNRIVEHLRIKVRRQKYRLTIHAEKEREEDQITRQELEEAILSDQLQVIENYPTDPRGPSCLLLGFTQMRLPIHMVCGHLSEEEFVVITIYRPDARLWTDWRVRKEPK